MQNGEERKAPLRILIKLLTQRIMLRNYNFRFPSRGGFEACATCFLSSF